MLAYHWELMDEMSPEMRSAYLKFTSMANEGEIIPKKYRELMVLGMSWWSPSISRGMYYIGRIFEDFIKRKDYEKSFRTQ